jgi:hypothetical protein
MRRTVRRCILAGSREPKTIFWSEALAMFAAAGFKLPERELIRAIISNSVGYYPRKALDLDRYYRMGLLDSTTGVLKMHASDSGTSIRPILTAIEQYLEYLESEKAKAGGEDQKLRIAPEAQIVKAITAVYEEYKATGKKPPNVRQLVEPVQRKLEAQHLRASGRNIQKLADADKFKALRRRRGKTWTSEKKGHRSE